jgi:hypothetical protein
MRRIFILASILFLAGCATRPQPQPPETAAPQPPPEREPVGIVGLTAQQLVGHFGNPALQVREGTSLKLQFRGRTCILDAYLYPQNNVLRVIHVDTRTLSGVDYNQAACIASLE